MELDADQRASLLRLLRHSDPDMNRQGVELMRALPSALQQRLLRGVDLSRARLRGADLRGFDLSGAVLQRASLREAFLAQASLVRADLGHAALTDADLSGATLDGAQLNSVRSRGVCLAGASLRGASLYWSALASADLSGADLSSADLRSADLSTADLTGSALGGCLLDERTRLPEGVSAPEDALLLTPGTALADVDLSARSLTMLRLDGADLSRTRFSSCTVTSSRLEGCRLRGASFAGAALADVRFSGADLSDADLSETSMRQVDLSGARLQGADLRGAQLEGVLLLRADLSGAQLEGARFEDVNCVGAVLACPMAGASFVRCVFKGAVMPGADLRGAELTGAVFTGADLSDACLRGVTADLIKMRGARLRGADLSDAVLHDANLRETDLRDARLCGADLSGARLREADLSGADLSGADLRRVGFQQADLSGADLSGADLRGAGLIGADLAGARLDGARLEGALCDARWAPPGAVVVGRGADLSGMDLRGLWLVDTDLRDADLSGADLRGGSLRGVDLRGADLSGAQLGACRLVGVHHGPRTRWPVGFAAPAPPALLQPQPQPVSALTVREALVRLLASRDDQIQQRAALALARLGEPEAALRARLPAIRGARDRSDELMALAAHCPPLRLWTLLPESLPGREGALIASQTAALSDDKLAQAILHPARQGDHQLVRAAHRMVLRELRPPSRAAVIERLRAAIPKATLGARALRRLRVVDGLQGLPADALRALLMPGLLRGRDGFLRAAGRACRNSSLSGDPVLRSIFTLRDAALRRELIARWDAPAARHRWLRETVLDRSINVWFRRNLALLLQPDTDRDVFMAAARAEPEMISMMRGPLRSDLVRLIAEQLDADTLSPQGLYLAAEGALGVHQSQIAPRVVAAYVRGQTFLKPIVEALSRRAPQLLLPMPRPLVVPWLGHTARAMLRQSEAPAPAPAPISREDLFRHDVPRRTQAIALLEKAPDAEAYLRQQLARPERQRRALLVIGQLGERGVRLPMTDAACALLADGTARDAARALRWMGDEAALGPLAARAVAGTTAEQRVALLAIAAVLGRLPPTER